jgi:DAK2 domain fusion protein YloV
MRASGCDGRRLLAALEAAAAWLDGHRAAVDALNVFPVPDGDTGTNMSMTLNAALREARESGGDRVGKVAERAAYGALMGARGNSGVILSQLLRGFARAVHDAAALDAATLAAALTAAAETAGRAVMKPVEGTILTVAAAAARTATDSATREDNPLAVLDATLAEARAAVARTTAQMPLLEQAGVVDAGAQGYMLILEGFARYLHGQSTHVEGKAATADSALLHMADSAPLHMVQVEHGEDYGYCTEFVITGADLELAAIRERIASIGTSLLVVGEPTLVRVHVHTEDPGRVLSYVAPLGQLHKIKIDNMQAQHDAFVATAGTRDAHDAREQGQPVGGVSTPPTPATPYQQGREPGLVGIVAVAPGEGLAEIFRSLGADLVVSGGQTMNPSTQELLAAIDELPQQDVILLPNNGNVRLAAEQACGLTRKRVTIVPARTLPQGMAALVVYSADADLATNVAAMTEAMSTVRTGEVTVAVRDAQLDGLSVQAGQALGLLDDEAVVVGAERDAVALDLTDRMGAAGGEILTIYYGADVTAQGAEALAATACERYGALEVEVVSGGQPHYPYIMSLE